MPHRPTTPHSQDRTAAGIALSFADAGRDIAPEMAEALATRIAESGSWSDAYKRLVRRSFSDWSEEDRWLYELVSAESDADNPQTAFCSIMAGLRCSAEERDLLRAARLLSRISGVGVEDARVALDAWLFHIPARKAA